MGSFLAFIWLSSCRNLVDAISLSDGHHHRYITNEREAGSRTNRDTQYECTPRPRVGKIFGSLCSKDREGEGEKLPHPPNTSQGIFMTFPTIVSRLIELKDIPEGECDEE